MGYKITDQQGMHFLTLTVVGWIDVFSRETHKQIVIDSLNYCKNHKGLIVHAYVIMTNHIHMIVCTTNKSGLSSVIRDFKSHTSKRILKTITKSKKESRKKWLLFLFKQFAKTNKKKSKYQFWKKGNHPIELFSPQFINQKLNYIHLNPVKAGIVDQPEHYIYSSATNYLGNEGKLEIELLSLMSDIGYLHNA